MRRKSAFTGVVVLVNVVLFLGVEATSRWLLERSAPSSAGGRRASFVVDAFLLWRPADWAERLRPLRERPGRDVVVSLGDSVTMGHDVPAGRDYTALLGRCLEGGGGRVWTVLNLGVEGYSTLQSLRVLEAVAPVARPRVVVLFAGWNDHWPHGRVPDAEVSPTRLRLRAWATTFATGRLMDRLLLERTASRATWVTRVPLADFEANLGRIRDRARASGARLILVLPVYYGPGARADGVEALHLRYVEAMRSFARRAGVEVVDLVAEFLDRPELFVTDPAFAAGGVVDYVHPGEAGHALVAAELCRRVGRGLASEGR